MHGLRDSHAAGNELKCQETVTEIVHIQLFHEYKEETSIQFQKYGREF